MTQSFDILVVDDDKDNAASLSELFEIEGHRVVTAYNGQTAIEAYQQKSFDLVFMDVVMPGKNGVESFYEIRKIRPEARVYMMTGYSVEQLLAQALVGGALGVLEKPFDPEDILRLTQSVGPRGLVLAPPPDGVDNKDLGAFIHDTLRSNGMPCRLVRDAEAARQATATDEVLLLDLPAQLIDGVEFVSAAHARGHNAQTVLVPHTPQGVSAGRSPLLDVALTGILNKPFDPLQLLNRLPQLAA